MSPLSLGHGHTIVCGSLVFHFMSTLSLGHGHIIVCGSLVAHFMSPLSPLLTSSLDKLFLDKPFVDKPWSWLHSLPPSLIAHFVPAI